MRQRRQLEGLTRRFIGLVPRREFTQFLMNKREQFIGSLWAPKSRAAFLRLTLTNADVSACQKEAPPGVTVRPVWEWLLEREK